MKTKEEPTKPVTKSELASIFGVSTQSVDGWLRRGCPYLKKGGRLVGYEFSPQEVSDWRGAQVAAAGVQGSSDGGPASRKAKAEASLMEIKLARELGHLVTLEDVEKTWSVLIANCRAKLLGIPSALAAGVVSAATPDEARLLMEAAIHEALEELSREGIGDQ